MQLFVDTDYKGHHSEYLDIIIEYHLKNNIKAAFIVHPTFLKNRAGLIDNRNILIFEYQCSNSLKDKYIEFKFINNIISNNSISECCLLNFNYYFKIFPIVKVNVIFKGIYFMPYLNKEEIGLKEKFFKYLYFKIILFKNNFNSIYILNDKNAIVKFNDYFETKTFKYLVDPVYTKNSIEIYDLPIESEFLNFSFLGEISPRKGIYQLLGALNKLPNETLNKINISIAGNATIYKDDVLIKINLLKDNFPSLFKEVLLERISDEKFEKLLSESDAIFCLHQILEGSSGIIGKAALFRTPVIGPKKGLIGALIKEYNLGFQLDTSNEFEIVNIIELIVKEKKSKTQDYLFSKYVEDHNPQLFLNILMNKN